MTAFVETKPKIIRVAVTEDAEGLALASQAWPPAERAGQLAALAELVQSGRQDELLLVVARRERELIGAILAQLVVGQAAVVWLPQLAGQGSRSTELSVELLANVHAHLAAAGALLAQSLVETTAATQLLESAGYVSAGKLLYMVAEIGAAKVPSPLDLESYSPANHQRLVEVIQRTYHGSLDCPLVDGIRPVEAVLAGYRAVGVHRPERWYLLREGNQDIGCLLLADHPAQDQWEIVYLGVVPEARGRGLGRALADAALRTASDAGRKRLVLAVDAANEPAIAAYTAIGMLSWDERALWVRRL